MGDRSALPMYDVFGDLVEVHCEGETIVLRIAKRNSPYTSAGELRKHFVGWQVALTFRKIKRVWSEQATAG